MTRGGRRARAAALAGLALGGCVYLNTLYNAREALEAGDRARLAGFASRADSTYRSALVRARDSWEADSLGRWAGTSLLLWGQATLRLGDPAATVPILDRLLARTGDPELRARARLYRGAALGETGDHEAAVQDLNASLFGLADPTLRAEAHLWRGRVLLALGVPDQGFWDLEQASGLDDRFLTPAALERLAWAIPADDTVVAAAAMSALARHRPAGSWADSVRTLLEAAADRWGPGSAAKVAGDGELAWAPASRDDYRLHVAGLLARAGRDHGARAAWMRIVEDDGPGAERARSRLARWMLSRARDGAVLDTVQRLLEPLARDSVLPLLEAVRTVRVLSAPDGVGLDRDGARLPSLFLAAERARDDLNAPGLARTLFLAAADDDGGGGWRGKALLAASALEAGPEGPARGEPARYRALLREGDPYLVRARNRYLATDTLAALDAALQSRMDAARRRAEEELRRRAASDGGGS